MNRLFFISKQLLTTVFVSFTTKKTHLGVTQRYNLQYT